MRGCRNGHDLQYFIKRMQPLKKFMWMTGAFEIYPSADCTNCKLNLWHPIGIILTVFHIVITFMFGGIDDLKREWTRDRLMTGYCPSCVKGGLEIISRFRRERV